MVGGGLGGEPVRSIGSRLSAPRRSALLPGLLGLRLGLRGLRQRSPACRPPGAEMAEEGKVVRTPEPDKEAHQAAVKKIQDEIEEKQNRMVSADSPALLWAARKGSRGKGKRRGWLQGRGG